MSKRKLRVRSILALLPAAVMLAFALLCIAVALVLMLPVMVCMLLLRGVRRVTSRAAAPVRVATRRLADRRARS